MLRTFIILFLITGPVLAQEINSTIRGRVIDADSRAPLAGATITLNPSDLKTTSDSAGRFRYESKAPGRYVLKVSFVGFAEVTLPEILLESNKEQVLEIEMNPGTSLKEVRISGSSESRLHGSWSISTEQTMRYAATYLDPARVTTSFPGVAMANDQANGMVVRGNNPNSMKWRLEGVEIVNPNHLSNAGTFSDRATQSGGGVSILSMQLLGATNFMNGAFPANYGNALAAVMDLSYRNGNNEKTEFTAQAGLIGLDVAAEGPLGKNGGSYLANYRYSFTGLLGLMGIKFGGEDIRFQDLSFNIHLPGKRRNQWSVFGMAGLSSNIFAPDEDSARWTTEKELHHINYSNKMGALGVAHSLSVSSKSSLRTILVASGLITLRLDDYPIAHFFARKLDEQSHGLISFTTSFTHRFSAKSTLRAGVFLTYRGDGITSNISLGNNSVRLGLGKVMFGLLSEPFATWIWNPTERLTTEVGLHYSTFSFDGAQSLEPRISALYQLKANDYVRLSYGLHGQMQLPQAYMPGRSYNYELGFQKAHHWVVGYGKSFNGNSKLKAELYYQQLFNIPISPSDPSFSTLNVIETNIILPLVSGGAGRNTGVEVSWQRFLTESAYAILAGSVYDAHYRGADGIWREARFNGRHTFSFTGGKEIRFSNKKVLGINAKVLWLGGFRDTPINLAQSEARGRTVYEVNRGFPIAMKDFLRPDLRVYWKVSQTHYNSTIALDIQNFIGVKNEAYSYFDSYQNKIVQQYQLGFLPILSYRMEF